MRSALSMTRCALAVHQVYPTVEETLAGIADLVHHAAQAKAELVVFSETALTGFVATCEPYHDYDLADVVPGKQTALLGELAARAGVWIAVGMYEREGSQLYDTAVLMRSDGTIALHYRRIDPHSWTHDADANVYATGSSLPVADTPAGRTAALICGDVFNAEVTAAAMRAAPDLVLLPFARGFDEDAPDEEAWSTTALDDYAGRARTLGVPLLCVNYIGDAAGGSPCVGGAFAFSAMGGLIGRYPLGSVGLLVVDV